MVGVGREKSRFILLLQERERADVDAVVVVRKFDAGEHAFDQDALAGTGFSDKADDLVKGRKIKLRDLHTERVDPAAAAGGKIGAVNMTVLDRVFRHRAVLLCVSSSIAHVVSLANSLIVLYNIIKLIYYKEEFSWEDFCIPPRRERTNPATSS